LIPFRESGIPCENLDYVSDTLCVRFGQSVKVCRQTQGDSPGGIPGSSYICYP